MFGGRLAVGRAQQHAQAFNEFEKFHGNMISTRYDLAILAPRVDCR